MGPWSAAACPRGTRAGLGVGMLLLCLLAPACAGLGGQPTPTTYRLSGADSGSSFGARVGDRIVVTLAENPSSGYRWDVAQGVGTVLRLVSSVYTPPAATPIAGAGGTRIFTFQAVQTGGVHLVLKQWRPSQGDKSIVQRFDITVEVGS